MHIYSCKWLDIKKYYCGRKWLYRRKRPTRYHFSREFRSKFERREKFRRVASANSQVAASFARSKSAGLTKCTTLCTTVARLSRESLVNRYRENLPLLIDDFYTHLHYSLFNNPVDFSHVLCTSILGARLSGDQKYLFIFLYR